MRGFEKYSALTNSMRTNLAVVVMQDGESEEEAWRRHLADNPKSVGVRVKIFHYPRHKSPELKKNLKTWKIIFPDK